MNLNRYNLAKRFRAVERVTLGNFNNLVTDRGIVATIIKCQNLHNAQLANLNDRVAALEAMLNLKSDPTNPTTIFVQRKRPDA